MASDLIHVCGLWSSESRTGAGEYLTGSIGGLRLFVFRNRRKESDRHPDYVLCVGQNQRREQRRDDRGERGERDERRQQTPNHDDLPF
jgi:hypothetical protein